MRRSTPRRPDPSPDEISRLCAEIQAGWSDGDRERRRAVKVTHWMVPVESVGDVVARWAEAAAEATPYTDRV